MAGGEKRDSLETSSRIHGPVRSVKRRSSRLFSYRFSTCRTGPFPLGNGPVSPLIRTVHHSDSIKVINEVVGQESDVGTLLLILTRYPPRRDYMPGSRTWSITWITPFDWATSYVEMFEIPPFASFSTTFMGPFIMAVRVAPFTVVKVAVP